MRDSEIPPQAPKGCQKYQNRLRADSDLGFLKDMYPTMVRTLETEEERLCDWTCSTTTARRMGLARSI